MVQDSLQQVLRQSMDVGNGRIFIGPDLREKRLRDVFVQGSGLGTLGFKAAQLLWLQQEPSDGQTCRNQSMGLWHMLSSGARQNALNVN